MHSEDVQLDRLRAAINEQAAIDDRDSVARQVISAARAKEMFRYRSALAELVSAARSYHAFSETTDARHKGLATKLEFAIAAAEDALEGR